MKYRRACRGGHKAIRIHSIIYHCRRQTTLSRKIWGTNHQCWLETQKVPPLAPNRLDALPAHLFNPPARGTSHVTSFRREVAQWASGADSPTAALNFHPSGNRTPLLLVRVACNNVAARSLKAVRWPRALRTASDAAIPGLGQFLPPSPPMVRTVSHALGTPPPP